MCRLSTISGLDSEPTKVIIRCYGRVPHNKDYVTVTKVEKDGEPPNIFTVLLKILSGNEGEFSTLKFILL